MLQQLRPSSLPELGEEVFTRQSSRGQLTSQGSVRQSSSDQSALLLRLMAEVRDLRQELASQRAPSGRVGEELRNERVSSVRVGEAGGATPPPPPQHNRLQVLVSVMGSLHL